MSQAIATLARMGEVASGAAPRLIQLVRDPQSERRRQAAEALSRIGPVSDVLPVLIEALEDKEDSGLQHTAARAIGHFGPAAVTAEPALVEAMKDNYLRQPAVDSLARIGTDSSVASALPVLIGALHNVDQFDGEEAAGTLGAMGPDALPAVPALVDVLADRASTGRIRLAAARALGELAVTTSETQQIAEALADIRQASRDDRLRNVIAEILAKIAAVDGQEHE